MCRPPSTPSIAHYFRVVNPNFRDMAEFKIRYRIKELAARKRITIKQVAQDTGISVMTLYDMSRSDDYNATVRTLVTLARYFGVTLDELVEIVDDHDEPPESS